MATMRDVADRAGVSIATVSFVVNNTKPVTAATRQRIEEAMAELGFRRNAVARALASRRTRILALAYPALEHQLITSVSEFITSAAREASAENYHLVVWPVSNDGVELSELVLGGLVDGVLLMEVQLDDPRVALLQSLDVPFAMIGRTEDPTGLDYVDIDFDRTIEVAVDHLWQLGHRRLALVSGRQDTPSFLRYGPYVRLEQSFRRAAAERGFDPVLLYANRTAVSGRQAARDLTETAPHVTGVLVVAESPAVGLLTELLRLGRQVPRDVSVISITGSLETAQISDPPLAVVTAAGVELGRLGVQALIRRLEGLEALPPQLRVGLFDQGESTAPPPAVRSRRTATQKAATRKAATRRTS